MNLLAIVQALHREAKLPGSPPSTVAGQSGRAADLVAWAIEAWNDIQRDYDGKWKWMRRDWNFNTVADDADVAYTGVTDTLLGVAITRFRGWDLDSRDLPFIYLVSDGAETQRELPIAEWRYFRRTYRMGTHTAGPPACIAVDPAGTLWLGPTPDGIYRLDGSYWRSNQELTAEDSQEPEMPSDYHMVIVYRALLKYAYDVVGAEVLAKATTFGTPLYNSLAENQGYSRFSFSLAGSLA